MPDGPEQPAQPGSTPATSPARSKPQEGPAPEPRDVQQSGAIDLGGASINISGDNVKFLQSMLNLHFASSEGKAKTVEVPLEEITQELPEREYCRVSFERVVLTDLARRTQESRVAFISCHDEDLAIEAAHSIIEFLPGVEPPMRRTLDLGSDDEERANVFIASLLGNVTFSKPPAVVVIGAFTKKAAQLLDPLLRSKLTADQVKARLRRKKISLLCLVTPAYLSSHLRDPKRMFGFGYWSVPFLAYLLEQRFENWQCLHDRILSQRQKGLWSNDDEEFYGEVRGLLEENRLQEVLDARDLPSQLKPIDTVFDEHDMLAKAVLYVAAFFQDLSPPDFSRVVESLLDDSTAIVTVPSYEEKDGSTGIRFIQRETALKKLWQTHKDMLIRKWLRTGASKDSTRVITLSDSTIKAPLRRYFEEEQGLYLDSQFKLLQSRGMLFHSSARIVENLNRLAVSMVTSYPDEYDRYWLSGIVSSIHRHLNAIGSGIASNETEMFQFTGAIQGNKQSWAYWRICEVMRALLDDATLLPLVDGCLENLIKVGLHEPALNIVKRLRFAPNFDEFRWFKRLLDQSNQEVRDQTESSLYDYMTSLGSSIYDFLNSVASWLPALERDPGSYSPSNQFALRILVEYCLYINETFDAKSYGIWPSPHPLFPACDLQTAEANFDLLIRWLFNPAINRLVSQFNEMTDMSYLMGGLMAEWAAILIGPAGEYQVGAKQPSRAQHSGQTSNEQLLAPDASTMLTALLRRAAAILDRVQKRELISYWRTVESLSLSIASGYAFSSVVRKELLWRRSLLARVVRQFQKFCDERVGSA